ncbi:MAG: CvpA family protein [Elusimicrobia bacterium]|nr:CvpA family protein [Elusimicrobiota bacterium]
MNWIDISILILVVVFAWIGLRIGILATISGITSGFLGFITANLLYIKFAAFLPPKASSLVISYFVIFLTVSIVIFCIIASVSKLRRILLHGLIGKFLSILLGVVLGIVVCGAVLIVTVISPSKKVKHHMKDSAFAAFVIEKVMAPAMKPFSKKNYKKLKEDIKNDVIEKIKSLPSPLD